MGFDNGIAQALTDLYSVASASFVRLGPDLWDALLETIYMVVASTIFSLVLGFLTAVVLIITGPNGLKPKVNVYNTLDFFVNMFRSLPFIILIIAIMPITRFVMGTTIGTTATILPLTVASAPFAARLIEGSFLEVDRGVIEAARSFGANTWQIIFRVMLPEALPAIVLNIAVLAVALLSYSAMAGIVGGGGLGDLAFRIGYQRFQTDATIWCILILAAMVQVIQSIGNWYYRRLRTTS